MLLFCCCCFLWFVYLCYFYLSLIFFVVFPLFFPFLPFLLFYSFLSPFFRPLIFFFSHVPQFLSLPPALSSLSATHLRRRSFHSSLFLPPLLVFPPPHNFSISLLLLFFYLHPHTSERVRQRVSVGGKWVASRREGGE